MNKKKKPMTPAQDAYAKQAFADMMDSHFIAQHARKILGLPLLKLVPTEREAFTLPKFKLFAILIRRGIGGPRDPVALHMAARNVEVDDRRAMQAAMA